MKRKRINDLSLYLKTLKGPYICFIKEKIYVANYQIEETFKEFCEKILAIKFDIDIAVQSFIDDKKILAKQSGISKSPGYRMLVKNFSVLDIEAGCSVPLGGKSAVDADFYNEIEYGLNKQFCWLLASAYEEYEKFVKILYGVLGYVDSDYWVDNHKKRSKEVSNILKSVDDYIKLSNQFSGNHFRTIIFSIRDTMTSIKKVETDNFFKVVNIWVYICFIECLRHLIVHNHGLISDASILEDIVFQKSGQSKTTKNWKASFSRLMKYFKSKDPSAIWLTNNNSKPPKYPYIQYNVNLLVDKLSEYVYLLYKHSLYHLYNNYIKQV